jgi:hypothetical protein
VLAQLEVVAAEKKTASAVEHLGKAKAAASILNCYQQRFEAGEEFTGQANRVQPTMSCRRKSPT